MMMVSLQCFLPHTKPSGFLSNAAAFFPSLSHYKVRIIKISPKNVSRWNEKFISRLTSSTLKMKFNVRILHFQKLIYSIYQLLSMSYKLFFAFQSLIIFIFSPKRATKSPFILINLVFRESLRFLYIF